MTNYLLNWTLKRRYPIEGQRQIVEIKKEFRQVEVDNIKEVSLNGTRVKEVSHAATGFYGSLS